MPTLSTWKPRDTLAALLLFAGAAGFTLWQNMHVAVLWDLAYLLDSSFRISLGQIPYREFPFAHAPGTFLVEGAIIRLFGRAYWHHILYACLANGAATLLTWRIAARLLLNRWWLSAMLATTLIPLGIYSIYPHPIYDSDCILSILGALYLLLRAEESKLRSFIAGAVCVLPLFFKQNIGLLFLAAAFSCALAIALVRALRSESVTSQLNLFAGGALTLSTALLALHFTVGLANYRYWTITFAAQRRLPGIELLLGIYHQTSLMWTIPTSIVALLVLRMLPYHRWTRIAALVLLAAPFLYAAGTFLLSDDTSDRGDALLSLWPHLLLLAASFAIFQIRLRPTVVTLLPIVLLATIQGTFLSQQLWGSTYALWPLLILLIALMLRDVPSLATPLALVVTAVFLICGTMYAASRDRLSYNHLDGVAAHAALPPLRGMTTPGPYLPHFEELIRVTHTVIPAGDGILLIPGQDPFYFASGRTPQFPVLLLDPATNPYTPQQMHDEAQQRNIRWLIVNRNLQLVADPVTNLDEYTSALLPDFVEQQVVFNYAIYRRR